jgi:hypothetical protein
MRSYTHVQLEGQRETQCNCNQPFPKVPWIH